MMIWKSNTFSKEIRMILFFHASESFYRRNIFLFVLFFLVGLQFASSAQDWAGFRGPNFDGSATAPNAFTITEGGQFKVVWRSGIGPGYSGIAVFEGRAVTMFSDGTSDFVAAFDTKTGKELWRYSVGPIYKGHDGSHDGPIASPLIADGRVFGLDPSGKLFALDFASGKELWTVDLAKSVGEKRKPFYGFATSPLVAGGVLIVETGEDANRAIAAFDPATGAVKWKLGEDTVNYQSPILFKVKGKDQVIAVGDTKLFGIDPVEGKILWDYLYEGEERAMARQSMVPVPAGDGLLFLKNKQDSSTMIRLTAGIDGKAKAEKVWNAAVIKGTYSLPVYHNGYLYGYNGRTVLTCVDAKTGELKWRSREPGDGFLLLLNGNLVIQSKEGSLHIGPANPEGWKETARVDLFDKVSWTNPSFAEGAIFPRHGRAGSN
jgi:outer membrane protein assembly factor BamB